jgi:hypothetical protein
VSGLGKCATCLDRAIQSADRSNGNRQVVLVAVPDAVVLATVMQQFSVSGMGGQAAVAPVLQAVCLACRSAQLGTVSKTGLALG